MSKVFGESEKLVKGFNHRCFLFVSVENFLFEWNINFISVGNPVQGTTKPHRKKKRYSVWKKANVYDPYL